MNNKFETLVNIEKNGYVFNSDKLYKLVGLFYEAGLRSGGMVPAVLMTGLPGAGKTFLAECFAKAIDAETIFYQMVEDTSATTLVGDINPTEIVRGNPDGAVSDGALIKAAKSEKPIVLILDEWDKSASELDAFLLDFLQSRRVRDLNGNMMYLPADNVWVFLTSNGDRNISDALSRRLRKWEIEKLPAESVAKILGIETNNQLLTLWDGIPNLALSQLEAYVQDMGGPEFCGGDIDVDILSQYIDIPKELSLRPKAPSSTDVTINVTVCSRVEYWNLEEALEEQPVRSKYHGSENQYQNITFSMENVVDWLRFSSNLRDMVNIGDEITSVKAEIVGDGDHHGAYVPLEFLQEVTKRCKVYNGHVAVVTKNGKLHCGEQLGELVHFEQSDITDLFLEE